MHPHWYDRNVPATFDLAVSYYGDNPTAFSESTIRHVARGGKWDGLYAFFADNPALLEAYDWVWLPDDDIATTAASINRLFDVVEEHALDVAQPSLTWDSFYSHFVTLHNPNFRLRWTNWVEVMVPVLDAALLRRALPTFAECRYGWGLEFLWPRWMPEPAFRTAIVDSVAVRHVRPVGKGTLSRNSGKAPMEERQRLMSRYLREEPRITVYAGIDTRGRRLNRGLRLKATLFAGWMPLRRQRQATGKFVIKTRSLFRAVRKMTRDRPKLTPLPFAPEEFRYR